MASPFDEMRVAGFEIPQGAVNPYAWVQEELIRQMYPPWSEGYRARYITLLTVLACNIALSLVYMAVYSLDMRRKGREVWCWRIVQRPAGRYFILNQYISYPVCSIVLAIMWIVFVQHLWSMFGTDQHAEPDSLFFFIPLSWIPYFIASWATTFACLSSANLTSKGHKPNTHRLSPWLANTLLLALPLAMVIAITCAGVWTGIKWKAFAHAWTAVYNAMGEAAAEWTGVPSAAQNERLGVFIRQRRVRFFDFRSSQHICTVIYCISAAVLIVINITGGVSLLATLRALGGKDDRIIVPRNEPLVAPLQPFTTGPSALDTTGAAPTVVVSFDTETIDDTKESGHQAAWEQETVTAGLKRLEWDVVLFFVTVVPSCLLFIVFSVWMTNNLDRVFSDARLFELSTQGLVFIFAVTSFLSLLALTIKTALSVYSSRTPWARANLPDETIEANLRRRASRGQQQAAGGLAGVMVVEWKEVESLYEEDWTGMSTTRGSLR